MYIYRHSNFNKLYIHIIIYIQTAFFPQIKEKIFKQHHDEKNNNKTNKCN